MDLQKYIFSKKMEIKSFNAFLKFYQQYFYV